MEDKKNTLVFLLSYWSNSLKYFNFLLKYFNQKERLCFIYFCSRNFQRNVNPRLFLDNGLYGYTKIGKIDVLNFTQLYKNVYFAFSWVEHWKKLGKENNFDVLKAWYMTFNCKLKIYNQPKESSHNGF